MISIDLSKNLEEHFWEVVRNDFDGDLEIAVTAFLKLHEKFGWKEQLYEDVESIRSEVRQKGGIKAKTIEATIKKYRKNVDGVSG